MQRALAFWHPHGCDENPAHGLPAGNIPDMAGILPVMQIEHHVHQDGNLAFLPEILVLAEIGIKKVRFFLFWYCHVFLSITISGTAGHG
ncbi:hypothetical protein [Komagataeibacter melomenusus]|uniref:hypothetical protein n=1 Tax=Komagataeibacter melomenusus TaxID=2766578 RepID=UPI001F512A0A|nr:hypothetical protein [Komagataeibacter melomenusus]